MPRNVQLKKRSKCKLRRKGSAWWKYSLYLSDKLGVSPVEALNWLEHNMIPVYPLGVYKDIEGGIIMIDERIIVAGFGGQGVMMIGKLLAHSG